MDKFALDENMRRVSPRNIMVREIVINYTPFAKNPTLAKFFREIGYADELGSGVKRITRNSLLYSGKLPVFEDKEMFKLTIPLLRDEKLDETDLINLANGTLNDTLSGTLIGTLNGTLSGTLNLTFEKIKNRKKITQIELSNETGIPLRTIKRNISILKENGYIQRVGSKKKGYWKILK